MFLKKIDIIDGDATSHRFRHIWRDALRQARASEERGQAVGGGTAIDQDKRYGDWFENPELVKEIVIEINKVQYKSLDFSHLN